MRVIAGSAKGRRLRVPRTSGLRPTTDLVKEAIFSMLDAEAMRRESNLSYAFPRALDLYAGSGALGIEALSRGADHVDFVEQDLRAAAALRKNLVRTGLDARGKLHASSVENALSHLVGPYDLILADPPYSDSAASELLQILSREPPLVEQGILVIEHERGQRMPEQVGDLLLDRARIYGSTAVSIYRRHWSHLAI